jgi:transcriptional regulator with XRE-family HTH domain
MKARRIQLHSFQTDVAKRIGVHVASVQNWERNIGIPLPCQIPAVIRFLGYVPFDHDGSSSSRLRWLRICAGWRQDELAAAARCGVSTIARLESGKYDHDMTAHRLKAERALCMRLVGLGIDGFIGKA